MSKLTDMLDRYRKKGSLGMKVGIMADKTYPDGVKAATVGYLNEYGTKKADGGQHIPPRPFFRAAIANNTDVLPRMIAALLKGNDPQTTLRLVGEHMVGELTDSVMTWSDPGNADSTIAQKGYDAPLRANDRLLRNSFSYEVDE